MEKDMGGSANQIKMITHSGGRHDTQPAPIDTGIINLVTNESVKKKAVHVVGERIKYYREKLQMEQKELGSRIGVKANAVSNWENGRTRPDLNLLPKICDALDITFYDLFDIDDPLKRMTAREQILLSDYRSLSNGHKYAVDQLITALKNAEFAEDCPDISELVFFEKQLAAGVDTGLEFEDEGEPIFLYSTPIIDKADCVFCVNGDSMEPEYHDGDMVLVERFPNCPELQYGEIGAFICGNNTYIKQYEEDGLHSLNPKYKVMRFSDEENLYMIGRVIGVLEPGDIASEEDVERFFSIHSREK